MKFVMHILNNARNIGGNRSLAAAQDSHIVHFFLKGRVDSEIPSPAYNSISGVTRVKLAFETPILKVRKVVFIQTQY